VKSPVAIRGSLLKPSLSIEAGSRTLEQGSIAAALAAVARGASIVRVHDVRETVDALKVWAALHG
jgi:dihydropteroate synthase